MTAIDAEPRPERHGWFLRRVARPAFSMLLAGLARFVTGVRATGNADLTSGARQRIYFANHASHGDFILLSTCLPPQRRERTRAAAAADYWGANRFMRTLSEDLLGCVLIERSGGGDPLGTMLKVLEAGDNLIIFPEGTRNTTGGPIQKFRSGLYNLALARPDVELVPCYIENMSRVLPKGEFLPVPLICRVVFGAPVHLSPNEDRRVFLDRARDTLVALDPRPQKQQQ